MSRREQRSFLKPFNDGKLRDNEHEVFNVIKWRKFMRIWNTLSNNANSNCSNSSSSSINGNTIKTPISGEEWLRFTAAVLFTLEEEEEEEWEQLEELELQSEELLHIYEQEQQQKQKEFSKVEQLYLNVVEPSVLSQLSKERVLEMCQDAAFMLVNEANDLMQGCVKSTTHVLQTKETKEHELKKSQYNEQVQSTNNTTQQNISVMPTTAVSALSLSSPETLDKLTVASEEMEQEKNNKKEEEEEEEKKKKRKNVVSIISISETAGGQNNTMSSTRQENVENDNNVQKRAIAESTTAMNEEQEVLAVKDKELKQTAYNILALQLQAMYLLLAGSVAAHRFSMSVEHDSKHDYSHFHHNDTETYRSWELTLAHQACNTLRLPASLYQRAWGRYQVLCHEVEHYTDVDNQGVNYERKSRNVSSNSNSNSDDDDDNNTNTFTVFNESKIYIALREQIINDVLEVLETRSTVSSNYNDDSCSNSNQNNINKSSESKAAYYSALHTFIKIPNYDDNSKPYEVRSLWLLALLGVIPAKFTTRELYIQHSWPHNYLCLLLESVLSMAHGNYCESNKSSYNNKMSNLVEDSNSLNKEHLSHKEKNDVFADLERYYGDDPVVLIVLAYRQHIKETKVKSILTSCERKKTFLNNTNITNNNDKSSDEKVNTSYEMLTAVYSHLLELTHKQAHESQTIEEQIPLAKGKSESLPHYLLHKCHRQHQHQHHHTLKLLCLHPCPGEGNLITGCSEQDRPHGINWRHRLAGHWVLLAFVCLKLNMIPLTIAAIDAGMYVIATVMHQWGCNTENNNNNNNISSNKKIKEKAKGHRYCTTYTDTLLADLFCLKCRTHLWVILTRYLNSHQNHFNNFTSAIDTNESVESKSWNLLRIRAESLIGVNTTLLHSHQLHTNTLQNTVYNNYSMSWSYFNGISSDSSSNNITKLNDRALLDWCLKATNVNGNNVNNSNEEEQPYYFDYTKLQNNIYERKREATSSTTTNTKITARKNNDSSSIDNDNNNYNNKHECWPLLIQSSEWSLMESYLIKAQEIAPTHAEVYYLFGLMHLLQVLFSDLESHQNKLHLSEAVRYLHESLEYTYGSSCSCSSSSMQLSEQFMALGVAQEAMQMNEFALRSYAAAAAAAAATNNSSLHKYYSNLHIVHDCLGELQPIPALPIPLTKFMYLLE